MTAKIQRQTPTVMVTPPSSANPLSLNALEHRELIVGTGSQFADPCSFPDASEKIEQRMQQSKHAHKSSLIRTTTQLTNALRSLRLDDRCGGQDSSISFHHTVHSERIQNLTIHPRSSTKASQEHRKTSTCLSQSCRSSTYDEASTLTHAHEFLGVAKHQVKERLLADPLNNNAALSKQKIVDSSPINHKSECSVKHQPTDDRADIEASNGVLDDADSTTHICCQLRDPLGRDEFLKDSIFSPASLIEIIQRLAARHKGHDNESCLGSSYSWLDAETMTKQTPASHAGSQDAADSRKSAFGSGKSSDQHRSQKSFNDGEGSDEETYDGDERGQPSIGYSREVPVDKKRRRLGCHFCMNKEYLRDNQAQCLKCSTATMYTIAAVRQHHKRTHFYCVTCNEHFETRSNFENSHPKGMHAGRERDHADDEIKWLKDWNIIFPGQPPPVSAYLEDITIVQEKPPQERIIEATPDETIAKQALEACQALQDLPLNCRDFMWTQIEQYGERLTQRQRDALQWAIRPIQQYLGGAESYEHPDTTYSTPAIVNNNSQTFPYSSVMMNNGSSQTSPAFAMRSGIQTSGYPIHDAPNIADPQTLRNGWQLHQQVQFQTNPIADMHWQQPTLRPQNMQMQAVQAQAFPNHVRNPRSLAQVPSYPYASSHFVQGSFTPQSHTTMQQPQISYYPQSNSTPATMAYQPSQHYSNFQQTSLQHRRVSNHLQQATNAGGAVQATGFSPIAAPFVPISHGSGTTAAAPAQNWCVPNTSFQSGSHGRPTPSSMQRPSQGTTVSMIRNHQVNFHADRSMEDLTYYSQ